MRPVSTVWRGATQLKSSLSGTLTRLQEMQVKFSHTKLRQVPNKYQRKRIPSSAVNQRGHRGERRDPAHRGGGLTDRRAPRRGSYRVSAGGCPARCWESPAPAG